MRVMEMSSQPYLIHTLVVSFLLQSQYTKYAYVRATKENNGAGLGPIQVSQTEKMRPDRTVMGSKSLRENSAVGRF